MTFQPNFSLFIFSVVARPYRVRGAISAKLRRQGNTCTNIETVANRYSTVSDLAGLGFDFQTSNTRDTRVTRPSSRWKFDGLPRTFVGFL